VNLAYNPPKLPKIGITRFIGTNKYDMFQYISKDPIICGRYNYAEMKCKNDKWNIHGPPKWYLETEKYILDEKDKLIAKILEQVKVKLPSMVVQGDKVRRFHSFLRVAYDHLFQGKWDVKAKLMNKYDKDEPLLYQLTFPQLYYVYQISKSLENKNILSRLNTESLRYRNKLQFPMKNINYRENQEYYVYTKKGSLDVEPYFTEIRNVIDNYKKMYNLLVKYVKNEDFIGINMIIKYCKSNKFLEVMDVEKIMEVVEVNVAYTTWIDKFNWKIAEPYQPTHYIL